MKRIMAVVLGALLCGCRAAVPPVSPVSPPAAEGPPPASAPETVSVVGVGDIMLGTRFPEERFLPPGEGESLLSAAVGTLSAADVAFGNLEGVLLDGEGEPKQCRDPKVCYLFQMPEAYVGLLARAGFDALSTANNHANDFGPAGRRSTLAALAAAGLEAAGAVEKPWAVFDRNGVRYGLAAFAPNKGTVSLLDTEAAASLVAEVAGRVQVMIVSFHGGAEGPENQRLGGGREFYQGEDRGDVVAFAHRMVEAGADVVFGHGPHVPRAVEVYRDRFIAYSLGNFCTYGRFNLSEGRGLAPAAWVVMGRDGAFREARILSFNQEGLGGVRPDPQAGAFKKIRELTRQDFSDGGGVLFEEGGWVRKRL